MSDRTFGEIVEPIFHEFARQTAREELEQAFRSGPFGELTQEKKDRAAAIVDKLDKDGNLMDFLEVTMPKECPECGHVD